MGNVSILLRYNRTNIPYTGIIRIIESYNYLVISTQRVKDLASLLIFSID